MAVFRVFTRVPELVDFVGEVGPDAARGHGGEAAHRLRSVQRRLAGRRYKFVYN